MEPRKMDLPLGGHFEGADPVDDETRQEPAEAVEPELSVTEPEPPIHLPTVQPEAERTRTTFRSMRRGAGPAATQRPAPKQRASQSKPVRTPQPLAHEPRCGLNGLLWRLLGKRLYDRYGWTWLVRYTKRDRVLNALDELWELRTVRKIIATVNSGGGSGKTTITTWLAAAAAIAFKNGVVCIDANENAGHTADRFRIAAKPETHTEGGEPEAEASANGHQVLNGKGTLRLREFVHRRDEFAGELGRSVFLSEVDRHRETGAFIIASNAVEDGEIDRGAFEYSLCVMKNNEQLVFADCGNGLKSPTNHGAVHVADTLVFPGNFFKEETLDDLRSTRERYANLGYPDKVSEGFVVILGDNQRKRKKYAKRYGVPLSHVIVFPVNRYMRGTNNLISIDRLPLRLQVILFESLLAIVKA